MEYTLNKQEKEILELLKQNVQIKDIAEKLNISHHTVKSYKSKLEKINVI